MPSDDKSSHNTLGQVN